MNKYFEIVNYSTMKAYPYTPEWFRLYFFLSPFAIDRRTSFVFSFSIAINSNANIRIHNYNHIKSPPNGHIRQNDDYKSA